MSNDLRLVLNVDEMKELIIDLQITRPEHTPLSNSGCTVERRNNTSGVVEWLQQRVHFLRKLKQTSLSTSILLTFYKGIVASVLSYCMSTRYSSCSMTDKKTLQMEWEKLRGSLVCLCPRFLPESLQNGPVNIVRHPSHPPHNLFELLPSGKQYRSMKYQTCTSLSSFLPQAVRLLKCQLWPCTTRVACVLVCFVYWSHGEMLFLFCL